MSLMSLLKLGKKPAPVAVESTAAVQAPHAEILTEEARDAVFAKRVALFDNAEFAAQSVADGLDPLSAAEKFLGVQREQIGALTEQLAAAQAASDQAKAAHKAELDALGVLGLPDDKVPKFSPAPDAEPSSAEAKKAQATARAAKRADELTKTGTDPKLAAYVAHLEEKINKKE